SLERNSPVYGNRQAGKLDPRLLDAAKDFFIEGLMLEADVVDTHELDEVDLLAVLGNSVQRRIHCKRKAHFYPAFQDADSLCHISSRFRMNDDAAGARGNPFVHDLLRLVGHEVYLEIKILPARQAFFLMKDLLE